jgi:flagellin-like protein
LKRPIKERPVFPVKNPLRKLSDERGVSPVIAVILMVAITVVLSAVLYVMVMELIGDPGEVEYGSVSFQEDVKTPTKYFGEYDGNIKLQKVEIKVFDNSLDSALVLEPFLETTDEIEGGLSISYQDINEDGKLNASDLIIINGGEAGDRITVVDSKAGRTITSHTLQ